MDPPPSPANVYFSLQILGGISSSNLHCVRVSADSLFWRFGHRPLEEGGVRTAPPAPLQPPAPF